MRKHITSYSNKWFSDIEFTIDRKIFINSHFLATHNKLYGEFTENRVFNVKNSVDAQKSSNNKNNLTIVAENRVYFWFLRGETISKYFVCFCSIWLFSSSFVVFCCIFNRYWMSFCSLFNVNNYSYIYLVRSLGMFIVHAWK